MVQNLHLGMLTRTNEEAETDSQIELIINENGSERVRHTFADTSQDDQERGQANIYRVGDGNANITKANLTDSSVRVGIRGDDQWRPELLFVWGVQTGAGGVTPIAIETGITTRLSTKASEGQTSMPLRLVNKGTTTTTIRRLLVMITTGAGEDDGTNSGIELQVKNAAGNLLVDFDVPDTPQNDQEKGQANLYLASVGVPFTRASLNANSIRLTIKGADAWRIKNFFVFGIDNAAGRPQTLVPLVHIPSWNLGVMSTDSHEGRSSVQLPLI